MTDSEEEENFCLYGNPLEPFDEDEIPSKKPISIEDQIATDAHGRRRFHGAFTGGFSAGFCNTVGSLEGWKPTDFKSSRSSKAGKKTQRPEDFMDDEDIAEFGFAPQGIRTTDDYNTVNTRKRRQRPSEGPIPGQPVLQVLLEPVKETIGVKLLKQMGWRPGQGVGPRLTKTEKKKAHKRLIGCEMPPGFNRQTNSDESNSDSDLEITFAPDDYEIYTCKPKENTSGMGYKGLNKNPVLSGFAKSKEPSHFSMVDRNNKKLSIQGQAFGVGAFEEDDEDIYSRDDMSNYDFELKDRSESKSLALASSNILENFVRSSKPTLLGKIYDAPVLPKNFVPKHGVRISRFEPLPEEKAQIIKQKEPNRHSLTAEERSVIIGDNNANAANLTKVNDSVPKSKPDNFKPTILGSTKIDEFKPFASDPDKQERYEKYLKLINTNEKHKLADIQPISMTEWDREHERVEFEKAANMYKPRPTDFLVFDRFVSAQQTEDLNNPLANMETTRYLHGTEDMREAAKRKMFGKLTREINIWAPSSLLCKRFNVPEPFNLNTPVTQGGRKKNRTFSVFDYLKNESANQTHNTAESPSIEKMKQKKNIQNTGNNSVDLTTIISKELSYAVSSETPGTSESQSSSTPQTLVVESINPLTSKAKEILAIPSTSTVNVELLNPILSNKSLIADETPPQKNVDEDLVLHTEEKIDLYRAIFLSSSESESEPEPEAQELETSSTKLDTFKRDLIEDIQKIEVQTNSFPLAVVKPSGIFANIDLKSLKSKPTETKGNSLQIQVENNSKTSQDQMSNISNQDESTYGPKLPINVTDRVTFVTRTKDTSTSKIPNKTIHSKHTSKSHKIATDDSDIWIEKTDTKKEEKAKKSKKKSHKKHKKSSKKHRRKHSDDFN